MQFQLRARHALLAFLVVTMILGASGRVFAAANFTVTRTSAADYFIDTGNSLTSAYASYLVTNNDGVVHNDVWVKIGSFTGNVGLNDATVYKYQIGAMNHGDVKPAFFYLKATATSATAQAHTISLYDGDPDKGGALILNQNFTISTVQSLITAASNTITGGSVAPQPNVYIGQQYIDIQLSGETGILGAGPGGTVPGQQVYFAGPSAYTTWAAKSFKLVSTSVTFALKSAPSTPISTFANQLAVVPNGADTSNCVYTITYRVLPLNTTANPTPVAPIAYINSGTVVKHTAVSSMSAITPNTIPSVDNGSLLTTSVSPSSQAPNGPVTFTVTASNSGPLSATLSDFQSTLPAGFTYSAGSSKIDGVAVGDPTNNAGVLVWSGPYTIASGAASKVLTFAATVSAAPGTYGCDSIAMMSAPVEAQIDSTASTLDNAPAVATVTVVNLPPPSITSLSPSSGAIGQTITITGTGFTGVDSVTFNGTAATGFTVVSDTRIVVTVPVGATTGNVEVSNFIGSDTEPFTVIPAPVITTLNPSSGIIGDPITITGVNFTGVTEVLFGGVNATFTFVDDNTITTNVPAGAGPYVTVTTPGGVSNQAAFTVNGAPVAISISPTSGVPGTVVTITGSGFTGATGIMIGSVPFTSFTVDNDGQITATIPVGAVTGDIVVTTAGGSSNPETFTVPAPDITSFAPTTALPGDTVTLTGQYFTGVTNLAIGGTIVTPSFVNDSEVTFTVPANIGNGQMTLTTPAGSDTIGTFGFPVPTLTGFSPTSGFVGDTVTLTGTHFTMASQVTFGGVAALTYTVVDDSTITVVVPPGAGSGLIAVTVPGGTADSSTCVPSTFTVIGTPSNITFTPASGLANTIVTITGTNFTGATAVKFNTEDAVSFTVDSDTQITATAPGGSSTGKVSVTNPAGTGTSADDWTLLYAPTISGFTPTNGPAGTTITITGAHFTGATSVKIGGVECTSFIVVDDGTITAVVAGGAITGLVEVTTPNGVADSSACPVTEFTVIPVPAITGLSPNHGVHGTVVTLTGSGFTNATAVEFGTLDAQAFTVVSDTEITATAPLDVVTAGVTVTTAGGTSASQTFTLDPPAITDFTPKVGLSGTVVTITGSGFTDATNVTFNGAAATGFTVVSDTQLTTTAPVGVTAGKIAVTTHGGTAQTAVDFTLPVPSISSFTPTSGVAGTTVVTLTGLNFLQASQVTFGGVAATQYTVDSNTRITATLPVGANTGVIAVTVPGGTADTSSLEPSQLTVIGAPTITGFTPTSGYAGVTVVTITGTTFTGASAVKFNGVSATSFTVVSDTQIVVTCPVGAATGPLTVVGVAGSAVSVGTFTVIGAPIITDFSPKSGPAGSTVTLTGQSFTGATSITIGGVAVTSFTVNDDGSITLVVPDNGLTGKITVTTPGGTGSTATDFKVAPTITSFSPQTGGPGTSVVIKGLNFTGATQVTIGGVPVTSFVVNDDGTITAVVGPNGLSGNIVVTTPGGTGTSTIPFVYVGVPQITSFTPTHGPAGTSVTITGRYLLGATAVNIGGTPVKSFTVVDDTTIVVVTASGTTGRIAVTTSYGTGQSASDFTFDVVTATVISADTGGSSSTASAPSVAPGGAVALPALQVRNTGNTPQTIFSVTIQIDNPSLFASGTLTATAAAGRVSSTVTPIGSSNVFTFTTPLLVQPGEIAALDLNLVAAQSKGAAAAGALALLLPLLLIPRRTRRAAMMLVLACGLTLTMSGCGSGGGSVGGVNSANGSYTVGANPVSANIVVTQIVGKGPANESVNYPGLPAKLGSVTITQ